MGIKEIIKNIDGRLSKIVNPRSEKEQKEFLKNLDNANRRFKKIIMR